MDAVYQANGIIKFEPYMKLKLNASVIFDSPYGNKIMLSSTSDNDMNVEITLQPGTEEDTKEIAALELKRICDLLSYFHNIAIMESRITGMAVETVTPEGKHIKTIDTAISIDVRLSSVKGFDDKSTRNLIANLEKLYPEDFNEVISIWKEAISTETSALKYLLLYRLLEYMFNNDTKALTNWIKKKEPSVQCFSNKKRQYEHSIYTYLRDNIHVKPEQKAFPLQEIRMCLPKLQDLVKQRIEESYNA